MPSSQSSIIPCVISVMTQIQPRSILDVGIGFGKWGYLFREYTDIIWSTEDPRRYSRDGWQVRIDGVEAFAPYLHEGHRFAYNNVYVGDVVEVLPTLGAYDLIFMGEIIEHVPIETGIRLLRTALEHANRYVVVTTPMIDTGQDALCGNPLERHVSLWKPEDFGRVGPHLIGRADIRTHIVAYPKPGVAPVRLGNSRVVADPPPPAPRRHLLHRLKRLVRTRRPCVERSELR